MEIKVEHIGIMVKDLDKTVKYLEGLGIGPWKPLADSVTTNKMYRGKPANYKIKIAAAWAGPVEIELLEHIEGDCIQKETLDRQGEGLYHIGYFVDDYQKEVAELKEKGLEVVQSGKKGDGGFTYFDTGIGHILVEPIQRPDTPDMYTADPESYYKK